MFREVFCLLQTAYSPLPTVNCLQPTAYCKLLTVLALFRNNQFTTAIPLALYVVLTHLTALLGRAQPVGNEGVEAGVLYRAWFFWLEKEVFWSAAGAAILVYVQALLVNALADEFRLLGERSWLPGLFYALAVACLPEFLFLSPPLVAATFVPLVLRRIFKAYNQPKATALVFDAAFWTTVAALFYPPALYLLIAVFFGLGIMRSYTFRERIVSLTGVATVLFLGWLWYFWADKGLDFWHIQFGRMGGIYQFDKDMFDQKTSLEWIIPVLLFFTIVLSYGTYIFRKLIQTQKCISVLYWFWFVAGLSFLLLAQAWPAHFMLMAAPTGVFLALSFSAFKKNFWAEILHLAVLGLVLFIHFSGSVDKGL
ncbi:MAG: hypothetical protein EPGJADBJ_01529 [Saprospiraceae bacterium]|nr:hypothetical protein [Saprospiraceae bacterium]